MNPRMSLSLAALLICVMSAAQDTNNTNKLTRYVTGCLQRDHSANEYQLNTENAKWHLKSDNVSLADHVGQEVKVSGAVSNQPYHGMKEDLKAAVEANPTETGVLTVTNLDIVSNTCAR